MRSYSRSYDEDNGQLEFTFGDEQNEQPTRRFVLKVAKRAGISVPHARAAIVANGPRYE
jgi:hypothetical protein